MTEKNSICYITYAIPSDMMPQLPPFFQKEIVQPEPQLYPDGFMPDWFFGGCFPEDDIAE